MSLETAEATRSADSPSSLCVILAAFNASATIARAVTSALTQAEVSEVVVVDDRSADETADVARACEDGTGRLIVLKLRTNAGPSHARNIAIAHSRAPLIAILDADDFLLPGRFADLLAQSDWDMIADNIAFVPEDRVGALDPLTLTQFRTRVRQLDTASFVKGCLTQANRYRGELGFLKPVMRREFLDRHDLRYNEEMRLAEDFDLYTRALLCGARFRIASTCGYVAVERPGSLSGAHSTADLARFAEADRRLLSLADGEAARALSRHYTQTRRKYRHRDLLARKRENGTLRAIYQQAREPWDLLSTLTAIARDKIRAMGSMLRPIPPAKAPDIRFLFDS